MQTVTPLRLFGMWVTSSVTLEPNWCWNRRGIPRFWLQNINSLGKGVYFWFGYVLWSILFPTVFPAPGTVPGENRVGVLEPTWDSLSRKKIKDNRLNWNCRWKMNTFWFKYAPCNIQNIIKIISCSLKFRLCWASWYSWQPQAWQLVAGWCCVRLTTHGKAFTNYIAQTGRDRAGHGRLGMLGLFRGPGAASSK